MRHVAIFFVNFNYLNLFSVRVVGGSKSVPSVVGDCAARLSLRCSGMVSALAFALALVGTRPASALCRRCCREFDSNLCVAPHCHRALLSQLRCIISRTARSLVTRTASNRPYCHVRWPAISLAKYCDNEMLIAMVLPSLSRVVETQC